MQYTKAEFVERIRRGDFHGLKFAGLVRLSFEPKYQKDKGRPLVLISGSDINGREDQEERCRRYIEERGGEYIFSYDEPNTSAWRRKKVVNPDGTVEWRVNRPVYKQVLEDLKRGVAPNGQAIDGLVVYDLDRLTRDSRNLEDAIDVADHFMRAFIDITGTLDLLTLSGKDNARFLVTVKGRQSADTSRRVYDRHEAIAMAGIPVGGSRPFGWDDDKKTLHPVESELLKKARLDLLAGIGLHTVCREWSEAGIKTPKGNPWQHTVLRTVLLSPRLAGYRVYQGNVCLDHDGKQVMGQYEPVFTVQEWEDLKAYLERGDRSDQDIHTGGRKRLLSGITRCGLCGTTCRSYADKRLNTYYYACPPPTGGGCGKVSINGTRLDGMIEDQVLSYLAGLEVQAEIVPWPHSKKLASKEAKIKELMDAYQADELPKEHVFPAVAKLNKDVAALKRDRAAWNRQQQRTHNTTSSVIDEWPHMSTDRRRAVVENVIHTVAINRRTIKQARFDPDRVEVVWRKLRRAELQKKLSVLLSGVRDREPSQPAASISSNSSVASSGVAYVVIETSSRRVDKPMIKLPTSSRAS